MTMAHDRMLKLVREDLFLLFASIKPQDQERS